MGFLWVLAAISIVGGTLNVVYSEAIARLNAKFLEFIQMPQWYIDAVCVAWLTRAVGIGAIVLGIGLMVAALLFTVLQ